MKTPTLTREKVRDGDYIYRGRAIAVRSQNHDIVILAGNDDAIKYAFARLGCEGEPDWARVSDAFIGRDALLESIPKGKSDAQ